jgi:hypothetical protein
MAVSSRFLVAFGFGALLAPACSSRAPDGNGSSTPTDAGAGASDDSGGSQATTGPVSQSDIVAFSRLTNAIPVQLTVGSASGWGFADTGNPWALLDPTVFPSAASLTSGGDIASIELASETSKNPFVFASTDGDIALDSTFNISANVGCSVLCGFAPSFNFRDVALVLDGAAPPSGLLAAQTVSFTLEGGGTDEGVAVPRSRIVVDVSLEGTSYKMIVDSGASDVTVSQAAYSALTADGRAQLSGGMAETTSGTSTTTLTRAATVAVGDVTATGVVIAHDTSFDSNLSAVSSDVGYTIDGSLGGTFLRSYYVTIDYTNQTLTLARYSDTSFELDSGETIGITLGTEGTSYVVSAATGDAATKGVTAGDEIVAIDGEQLADITPLEVATLVYGAVGSTKQVTFGFAATLAGMTVPIEVEESLPLPTSP